MGAIETVRHQTERIAQDVRYALRTLGRARVFTTVAVLCLALGIAANTTIFSVFDAVVLRPLPYAEPNGLVALGLRDAVRGRRASFRYDEYLAWRQSARSFRLLAAHASRATAITEGSEPERVSGRLVSASLFPLLGARAQLGRVLSPDDDQTGAANVVVIGDALWRRRYGGDSSVIGRVMSLDGTSYTIVGVMERGFAFPSSSELWTPIAAARSSAHAASARSVSVVARLQPGVDLGQASREAAVLGTRVATAMRTTGGTADTTWTGEARPLRGNPFASDEALVSMALFGATTFLLLIACVNVANLLVIRAVSRERELAVRSALGASRGRIAAQLLTEATLLAVAGCLVALPLVWESLRLIRGAIPPSDPYPNYTEWTLDLRTFAFAAIVSIATGMLFGVGPAIQATRGRLQDALKDGAQGSGTGQRRQTVRNALIAAEVALALVLLVGASLFVRAFIGLRRTELGYDVSHIMTMRFYLPGPRYDSARARLAAIDEVLRRAQAVPGVEAATVSDLVPLDDEGGSTGAAVAEGRDGARVPAVAYSAMTGQWFETLGVTLAAGRTLTAAELRGGVASAVINQTMASAFWPGMSPIGRRFRFATDSLRTWFEVVGVAPDIRTVKLDEDRRTPPTAYIPLRFVPTRDYGLLVRTRQSPAAVTSALRAAVHGADPIVPVFNVWTMDDVRYLSFWMYALWGSLFGAFGVIALLLATIGVYGVIHYGVAQRTREIGIRVALGARRSDVLSLVLGRGVALTGIGVAVGLLVSLALMRVVESLLIGVSTTDPVSFAGVAVLLGGVSVLASYLPARRAARVDPLVALREE